MKKNIIFILFVVIAVFMTSCCEKQCDSFDFLQKKLVVVSFQKEHICCNHSNPPTMLFDTIESQVFGYTGCNRYLVHYQLTDTLIQFGMPGVTRMACDSAANALETKMFEVLNSANHYRVTHDELILMKDDDVLAVLKELKRPEDRCCGSDKGGCAGKTVEPCAEEVAVHCDEPCDKPCGDHAK
ncbi:MAG TPA: META domain-containing protein [Paludibacteraceae bacterium]|nr:META domain-containing protein [Paludibacteraceae bacterium]HQB69446.1 META domain-containing protein [Paludibacteraceae bacterium]HRS67113.1 META domain-containing protein [Paludibacteraceae bacterium]